MNKVFDQAVDIFTKEGLTATPQFLRRKIEGVSFWDRVKKGESPEDVALSMVGLLKRESEQRALLKARYQPPKRHAPLIGEIPHLSEGWLDDEDE